MSDKWGCLLHHTLSPHKTAAQGRHTRFIFKSAFNVINNITTEQQCNIKASSYGSPSQINTVITLCIHPRSLTIYCKSLQMNIQIYMQLFQMFVHFHNIFTLTKLNFTFIFFSDCNAIYLPQYLYIGRHYIIIHTLRHIISVNISQQQQ